MSLAVLLAFGVLGPLHAVSDPDPDEIEGNRVRLLKLREDPDAYAALIQKTGDFLRLPEERRAQVAQLDSELRRLDPAKRERLTRILKRYAAWQRRLSDADRQRLHEAPTANDRLTVVRELREADYVRHLPKAQRDQLERLSARDRSVALRRMRQERVAQKDEWRLAFRFWDDLMRKAPLPTKLGELPAEAQTYFQEYLAPKLSAEDLAALAKAEGHWPDYPRRLVELADRHPAALPGPKGPTHFNELPESLRNYLVKAFRKARPKLPSDAAAEKQLIKLLRKSEGKWPDFGAAVSELVRGKFFALKLPYELWPSRPFDLAPSARQFVETQLKPVLTPEEKGRLDAAANSWPRYPQTLQELAGKHGLRVPWQSLPGPPDVWNKYRFDQPAPVSLLWHTPRLAAPLT
jgi:hypothetical protein